MKKTTCFETNAIHSQMKRSPLNEHSTPIYPTSSFLFNTAEEAQSVFADEQQTYIYSRLAHPNNDEFIEKLCLLEKAGDGIATASGMAAVFLSLAAHLRAGDHVLASRSIFGSTHLLFTQFLPRWGITHTYVDVDDKNGWKKNLLPSTKMIFTETPSNPGLDIINLEYLGQLSRENDLYFVVDNSFSTPYLQRPIDFGADLVIHSTTKFIDGQGRTIGGAIIGNKEAMEEVHMLARQTGPTLSPFNSWILSKSLETLAVRLDRHCSNAFQLAEFLEKHKEVRSVRYPLLPSHPQYELACRQMNQGGGLVSFEVNGGVDRCMKFENALQLFNITANLGDTRSCITHPSTTTHSKLTSEEKQAVNITDSLLRVSVGLEHINDLLEDMEQALVKSKK